MFLCSPPTQQTGHGKKFALAFFPPSQTAPRTTNRCRGADRGVSFSKAVRLMALCVGPSPRSEETSRVRWSKSHAKVLFFLALTLQFFRFDVSTDQGLVTSCKRLVDNGTSPFSVLKRNAAGFVESCSKQEIPFDPVIDISAKPADCKLSKFLEGKVVSTSLFTNQLMSNLEVGSVAGWTQPTGSRGAYLLYGCARSLENLHQILQGLFRMSKSTRDELNAKTPPRLLHSKCLQGRCNDNSLEIEKPMQFCSGSRLEYSS